MIRFIHSGDVHLDSPLRGLSRYESAPAESIRNGCRRAFENLVDLAIDEKVAFVLLAGDLYDGDWKDYGTGIFLSKQMGRLSRHNIAVFVVAGNHDAANTMTRALDTPANMKIFSAKKTQSIHLADLGVVIHGRSFATRRVETNLAREFPLAEPGMFNIGLLHTSLDGREGHAPYAPCSVDDLRSKGYQYWALGHIHRREFVSEDPWIVFPGCIQGRHIRESGAKGCVLVTIEDGAVALVESRNLDVLRWSELLIDLSDCHNKAETIERIRSSLEEQITAADERPQALRIRLTGATPMAEELAAYPERLEQQIRSLAAELGGDGLWLERVENRTSPIIDLQSALAEQSSLGRLLLEIVTIPEDPHEIDGLTDIITGLRQKIPPEAFGPQSALDLDEPETIQRLLEEAKHLLVGRLLKVEENR